ncbi:restriction endonuclease subunit S [Streptomyces sp. NPDC046716]|uniref:restriction endonuclease subunit S n=1 Tax=Streptomyces sp. NPDC046716 TaxID=3157093 RepID=UPI0033E932F8
MSSTDTLLGDIIKPAALRRAGVKELPILSMTMRGGLVDQADKFKKRVASSDTSAYRVVDRGQLVVGFPIDEGVLSFQRLYDSAIVSPAYEIWDLVYPDSVSHNFLERFLRSPRALSYYAAKLQGSTARRRSLPRDVFLALPVPLPSLEAQERIAAALDQVDTLRAKRREAIALISYLAQSIFLDMFGDPMVNSKGWPTRKLGEMGSLDRGVSKHRPRNDPALLGGEIPLIQTGDVAGSGGYITEFTSTYSEMGLRQSKLWPAGTLCITIAANIAKTGILAFDACFPDSVVGFAASPARVAFIQAWLSFLQRTLEASASEFAQKNINLAVLRNLDVPYPGERMIQVFSERVQAIEAFKGANRAHLATLDELFSSLQHRAFSDTLWDHEALGEAV